MENLLIWEVETGFLPEDRVERFKIQWKLLEEAKKDLTNGVNTAWGMSPAGGVSGYALTKLTGDNLFKALSKYAPYIRFEVMPVISVDEAISSMKEMQKQMKP